MKQKLTFLLLISSLIIITNCTVKPANFADNYTYGSYARYKSGTITGYHMDITNISSYSFSAEINEYKGPKPSKFEAFLNIGKKEYLIKPLKWGDAKISITGLEMAKAVNSNATSAEDLSKHISVGRSYRFTFYPYDDAGNKIKDDPGGLGSDPASPTPTYRNINAKSSFAVSCPIKTNIIPGTYKVLSEGLGDLDLKTSDSLINVVYTNTDSILTIKNYPRPKFNTSGGANTTVYNVKVKLKDFKIGAGDIKKIDKAYGKYTSSGPSYSMNGVTNGAKVYTCDSTIRLSMSFKPGGSGYALNLKRH